MQSLRYKRDPWCKSGSTSPYSQFYQWSKKTFGHTKEGGLSREWPLIEGLLYSKKKGFNSGQFVYFLKLKDSAEFTNRPELNFPASKHTNWDFPCMSLY